MNVTFWLAIVLALVALWFLACFLFKPLGNFFIKIFSDAIECLEIDDENKGEDEQ